MPDTRGDDGSCEGAEGADGPFHQGNRNNAKQAGADDGADNGFFELTADPHTELEADKAKADNGKQLIDSPAIHKRDDAEREGDDGLLPGQRSRLLPNGIEGLEDVFCSVIDLCLVEMAGRFTCLSENH